MDNLVGKRFGKLVVIKENGRTRSKSIKWECICDCGNIHIVSASDLKKGTTTSCGCNRRARMSEYNSNPNNTSTQRQCSACKQIYSLDNFYLNGKEENGAEKRGYYCKLCSRVRKLLLGAKERSKKYNIPFNLTIEDIVIPEYCPLLEIKLEFSFSGKPMPHSPSLDRINPALGYVKGNVWVISYRANTLKSDSSVEELEMIITNLKKYLPRS